MNEIVIEISLFLESYGEARKNNMALSQRDTFLVRCCTYLSTTEDGIDLPKETVIKMVKDYPSIYFYPG